MPRITSLNSPLLSDLCRDLSTRSGQWQSVTDWPATSLKQCADAGVFRWFFPEPVGGLGWDPADKTRGYLKLSEADLTTTFIITQYMGCIRRIAGSDNDAVRERWLDSLISGQNYGTVGISHLTTSRRHLSKPILNAVADGEGFRLNGFSPWVTGAPHADVYVIGATLDDGREMLVAVPSDLPGVEPSAGADLLALSASCTDRVDFHDVRVEPSMLVAGPMQNVMTSGTGGTAGGLQTSTLALGLATAAVNYLQSESEKRADLVAAATGLGNELTQATEQLIRATSGDKTCDSAEIRAQANGLVMRTTQAAMTAAKGAGFVEGHPVGRWCRQALFFLVWSCPQPVAQAQLCELAGID